MCTIEQVIKILNEKFKDRVIDPEELEDFCGLHNWVFSCGETRLCVYEKGWTEVLKIARFENVEIDYNDIELKNYSIACDLGIEQILLPIHLVATLDSGLQVYAQQKFSSDWVHAPRMKFLSERNKASQLKADTKNIWYKSLDHCYDCGRIPTAWYKRAYQVYGKKFMRKFEKFTQDNSIGDLHGANCGFIGNRPIILDFAGYFEI